MAERVLRVLSNIEGLEAFAPPGLTIENYCLGPRAGAFSALNLYARSFRADVILLDGNEPYLWPLCLLRWLWRFGTCPLVVLDIMFVKPVTRGQRLRAWLHRQLLRRVDHFIHYFKDLAGYRHYFGISEERSTFVPFKVNGWERMPSADQLTSDGAYVITGGRSLRDLGTFLEAMRRVPYPGVLLYHDRARLEVNGTRLPDESIPKNVQLVEDDGSMASWLRQLGGAKLVVLTPLPDSIRAIGVSTYLDAMALKKCVIMTDSPATRGVLTDEALIVPSADPEALASAIRRAWEDDALREATAAAGRRYAEQTAGSARLFRDVLAVCARLAGKEVAAEAG